MQLKKITTVKEADSSLQRVKARCISLFVKLKSLKRLLHVSTISLAAAKDDVFNIVNLRGEGTKFDSGSPVSSMTLDPLALFNQFNVLQEIHQQRDALLNIIDNLQHVIKPGTEQRNMLKSAHTLLKNIDAELHTSRASISKITEAALPKDFKKIVTTLSNWVSAWTNGRAESQTIEYQAGPVDDELHFMASITLRNMVDDNGYDNPYYIIAVTDTFKPAKPLNFNTKTTKQKLESLNGEHIYSLNILHQPVLPGHFRMNKHSKFTTAAEAINILTELLRMDHITTQMTKRPLPKFTVNDLDEIKSTYVLDTRMDKDTLVVILKPAIPADTLESIKNAYMFKLKSLLLKSSPRSSDIISVRVNAVPPDPKTTVGKKKENNIGLFFEIHIPSDYMGKVLDSFSLQQLKKIFDLSDDDIRRVKQAVHP